MHSRRLIAIYLQNTNALRLTRKHNFVETLFRWAGKRLYHILANLIRKICTKRYQNRPPFYNRYDTNILVCFFRLTVLTAVHLQNVNAKTR